MKTYGWLSPEKLKFINENPPVLSLLYDLGLLPEEISARIRGIVEEETKELLRLKDEKEAKLHRVAGLIGKVKCSCKTGRAVVVKCEVCQIVDILAGEPNTPLKRKCETCGGRGRLKGDPTGIGIEEFRCPECDGTGSFEGSQSTKDGAKAPCGKPSTGTPSPERMCECGEPCHCGKVRNHYCNHLPPHKCSIPGCEQDE